MRNWKNISSLFSVSFLTIFFISYHQNPVSLLPIFPASTLTPPFSLCTPRKFRDNTKFLWYAPHSGFSNQLSEFKNAILIASILNRTLVVPPVLDHHAVALGSCPKFRVLHPSRLRIAVWNHVIELILAGRYVSMADIIDLSKLVSSSAVETIDFRHFMFSVCGITALDFSDSNIKTKLIEKLKQCGFVLSGLDGNVHKCLYSLYEDCRTLVWTYGKKETEDGALDLFQNIRKKNVSYVRRRRDLYKTLGPGSEAESATILAFGSLFSAPYRESQLFIDIHDAPNNKRIQNLIKKVKFLPFSPQIVKVGKMFISKRIRDPFLCVQLRLLDGKFKNHWNATFLGAKEKLESSFKKKVSNSTPPMHVFVMTDLPRANWTGNYLGDLGRDVRFKLHVLSESDELVMRIAKEVASKNGRCMDPLLLLHDMVLYVEQVICSCASLGFYGTSGSTIAESIELMRSNDACAKGS